MIRQKAKAAGKTTSAYLLDLARNDDPEIHPLELPAEEQQEILEGTRMMRVVAEALRRELPDTEGLNLLEATDAEWEMVQTRAPRRGLSTAPHLVGLAERDGAQETERPTLSLDAAQ